MLLTSFQLDCRQCSDQLISVSSLNKLALALKTWTVFSFFARQEWPKNKCNARYLPSETVPGWSPIPLRPVSGLYQSLCQYLPDCVFGCNLYQSIWWYECVVRSPNKYSPALRKYINITLIEFDSLIGISVASSIYEIWKHLNINVFQILVLNLIKSKELFRDELAMHWRVKDEFSLHVDLNLSQKRNLCY